MTGSIFIFSILSSSIIVIISSLLSVGRYMSGITLRKSLGPISEKLDYPTKLKEFRKIDVLVEIKCTQKLVVLTKIG